MKKIVITLLLMVLIPTLVNATFYNVDTPVIRAYLESISPYPVEPSQDFTIQMRIYNEGGKIAEDVKAEIEYDDYFFLKSKDDDFDKPFNLCVGCSKDNTYYFIVSPDTLSGEYPITIKINRGGGCVDILSIIRFLAGHNHFMLKA
jgi:hypothetical protein